MKKITSLFVLIFLISCTNDLAEEITYEQNINWSGNNISATIKTKYFGEQLNYILILENKNKPCIFDPNTSYVIYFRDKDGFNITEEIEYIYTGFTTKVGDKCTRFKQTTIRLDKNLYRKISDVSIGTRT
jgi:hypothetical protein